jgi:aminoglycoside/choline kinase family phosphotransferase
LNSTDTRPPFDEREALRRAFLNANGFGDARREPMSGDASTRAYERLHLPDGSTRILMDQAPRLETAPCPPDATPEERLALGYNAAYRLAAGRVDAFAAVAGYLRSQNLSAPEVIALDAPVGLAVLEDLGGDLIAKKVADGAPPEPLYETAIDVLAALHRTPPPPVLQAQGFAWPLLSYDALALKMGLDTFVEWWPAFKGLTPYSPDVLAEWDALWAPVRAMGEAGAEVFTHRDYHAENLIWLEERGGLARVGLIDFQDAVRGHRAWDMLHLLQDARRDVEPTLEAAMLDRYLAAAPEVEPKRFRAEYAALAALNNARLVGLWGRLVTRDGKPDYARFLPRTWGMLERDLAHPDLAPIKAWFDRHAPAETRR